MSTVSSRVVFITGATGFIGSAVVERLVASGRYKLVCLVRKTGATGPETRAHELLQFVHGDLDDPETYADALSQSTAVVHMAAATGTARESQLWKVNVEGTRRLLEASEHAGIERFLFMSSIAAAGDNVVGYPYARTKLEAEKAVGSSGLQHTIMRPTIVLSERGGNWRMLRKMACLPIIPAFGGGTAKIQPVDLVDVARGVELVLGNHATGESLIEIGGPEILSFADFLRRIRIACGQRGSLLLPVPVAPTAALLNLARRVFGESFPISGGQLAPFIKDGVAAPNAIYEHLRPDMAPLDELLGRIARAA